ncbi:MAG: DUF5667 domain-containing protein [Candidatus Levyibacteriota bacterium]
MDFFDSYYWKVVERFAENTADFFRKFLEIGTWVALLFLIPAVALGYFAQTSIPGNPLYNVKRGIEQLTILTMSIDPQIKATYQVSLVQDRFAEAQKLLASDNISELDNFNLELADAQDTINGISNTVEKEQLKQQLSLVIAQYQQRLTQTQIAISNTTVVQNNIIENTNLSGNNTNTQNNQSNNNQSANNASNQNTVTYAPTPTTGPEPTVSVDQGNLTALQIQDLQNAVDNLQQQLNDAQNQLQTTPTNTPTNNAGPTAIPQPRPTNTPIPYVYHYPTATPQPVFHAPPTPTSTTIQFDYHPPTPTPTPHPAYGVSSSCQPTPPLTNDCPVGSSNHCYNDSQLQYCQCGFRAIYGHLVTYFQGRSCGISCTDAGVAPAGVCPASGTYNTL